MSERLSSWWVRLYPASFRERYGDEMLLLFRDRMGDATGAAARMNIRLALIYDLAVTVPRVYIRHRNEPMAQPLNEHGVLTFGVLEGKRPSYWIYAASAIASLALLHSVESLHPCTAIPEPKSQPVHTRLDFVVPELFRFVSR